MLYRVPGIALEVDDRRRWRLSLRRVRCLCTTRYCHGSKVNQSTTPVGIAVRYIAPEVVQQGAERQIVQLVGARRACNFEIVARQATL